jgi:hypothetical protein
MTFTEWQATYKPIDNPISGTKMFATSGPERDFVLIHDFVDVWTLIESADRLELMAGAGFIKPLGYFVGEVPWDGGKIPANVPYTD